MRTERLVHVADDGEPLADDEQVSDLPTNALGWSHGGVRPATEAERKAATVSAGMAFARDATEGERARFWWMVRLPATIEQRIAEAERDDLHYFAAIWTQTWGTTIARVEVAMTW